MTAPTDKFIKRFSQHVVERFGESPDARGIREYAAAEHKILVHQGCGRVMGHGDYCSEGYYCGSCAEHAKGQARAYAHGWPVYRP